jgi:hypothetical protein
MAQRVPIDPDKGVTDLVRQLGDDSKRLLADEVRLAKLETVESLGAAKRGAIWLGVAFAFGVIVLVAFTLFSATAIGRLANGHYWMGALVTAVIDLAVGFVLVKRGMARFKEGPYSLPETRAGLQVLKGS